MVNKGGSEERVGALRLLLMGCMYGKGVREDQFDVIS